MTVAIFGATSRIARELALRYAERGETTILLARDLEEAKAIAADVVIRTGRASHAEAFDAMDAVAAPTLVARLEAAYGALETAILAFGDMGSQEESQRDPAALAQVIAANFTGAAALAEALAAVMSARGRGRIAAIGSVAGDRGRQSNYAYGSSKGALALYLEGLRNRLTVQKTGVTVLTVKLGFIDTRMTWGLVTKIPVASPETASRAIAAAMDRGENTLYYPPFWRAVMGVIRAIPEASFIRTRL